MDIMRLICYFLSGSVQWQTGFLYNDTTGHDANAPTDLKDAFVNDVTTDLLNIMSEDTTLGCIQVIHINGINVPNSVFPMSMQGSQSGAALPATNCMVINRRTNHSKRSVVRNFFSGLPISQVSDGMPIPALATNLNDLGDELIAPIGAANRFVPVVFDNSLSWVQPVRYFWKPTINCLRSRSANPCTVTA